MENKFSNGTLIKFGLIGLGVIMLFVFIGNFVSFSNNEIDLRNTNMCHRNLGFVTLSI